MSPYLFGLRWYLIIVHKQLRGFALTFHVKRTKSRLGASVFYSCLPFAATSVRELGVSFVAEDSSDYSAVAFPADDTVIVSITGSSAKSTQQILA